MDMLSEVRKLMTDDEYSSAVTLAGKLQAKAVAEKTDYGLVVAYRTMAIVQMGLMDYKEAVNDLNEAEKHLELRGCSNRLFSVIYYEKSRTYDYLNDSENAMKYAKMAIESAYDNEIAFLAQNIYIRGLYKEGRYAEFESEFKRFKNDPRYEKLLTNSRAEIYHYIYIGEYDKALAIAEAKSNPISRYEVRRDVFVAKGDHAGALEETKKMIAWKNSKRHQIKGIELAQMHVAFHKEEVRHDSANLARESTDLKLKNQLVETEKQESEKMRADEMNRELELQLQRNVLSEQQDSAEFARSQAEYEASKLRDAQRERYQRTLSTITITVVIVAFVMLCIGVYFRVKRGKLRTELQKRLYDAQESERLKSAFVQNVNENLYESFNDMKESSHRMTSGKSDTEQTLSEDANNLYKASIKMIEVVNDILEYSKTEAKAPDHQ